MKCSDKASVLNALRPYMEAEDNDSTPVRDCYRYVDNRPTQFDYKNAIDKGFADWFWRNRKWASLFCYKSDLKYRERGGW